MPTRYRTEPNWQDPLSEAELGRRVFALRLAWQRAQTPKRTIADFRAAAGIGNTTLHEIESGKTKSPDGETLDKIALVTGVPAELIRKGRRQTEQHPDPNDPTLLTQTIEAAAVRLARPSEEAHARVVELMTRYLTASGHKVD